MFIKINKIIKNHIYKQSQTVEQKEFERIKRAWKTTQTQKTKKNATIYDYKDDILTIETKNSAWRSEISLMSEQIKKK